MHQVLKTPCRHCTGQARLQEVVDNDLYTILGVMAKCSACGIRTPVMATAEAARLAWERSPPLLATSTRAMAHTPVLAPHRRRRAPSQSGKPRTLRSVIREHLRKRNFHIKTDLSTILGISPNGAISLMNKPQTKFPPRHVERVIERLGLGARAAHELRVLGALEAGWKLEALHEGD